MKEQNVVPAIDNLLNEIDTAISALNEQGAQLFSEGKYDRARALLNKVESISGFRGKVLCLKDHWKSLRVPRVTKITPGGKADFDEHARTQPLKPGLRTSPEGFRYPVLEALDRLGGAGRVRDVFRVVEEVMADRLNIYDYQPLPSDPNSVRWKTAAHWARHGMVQEGLLKADSPRGIWELSDAGREALKRARDNPDLQRTLFSGG